MHNYSPAPKYQLDPTVLEPIIAARPPAQYAFDRSCTVDGVRFEAGASSLPSPLHQNNLRQSWNEDEFLVPRSSADVEVLPVYAVFDGLSNPVGSERAAYIARIVIEQELSGVGVVMTPQRAEVAMHTALSHADDAIVAYGKAVKLKPQTTAVVARPFRTPEGAWRLAIGHVGDSRAIEFASDGESLRQLTLDHAFVAITSTWDEDRQYQFAQVKHAKDLSPKDLIDFKLRYGITKALGAGALRCTVRTYPLEFGARYVLATDGVHDPLTYTRMARILAADSRLFENAYMLTTNAGRIYGLEKSRGEVFRGKQDDATAVVFLAEVAYARRR